MLDANVLYPQFLRDVLLRLAASDLYLPHWSGRIHDEWVRNVVRNRTDLSPAILAHTREQMDTHFLGALIAIDKRERQDPGAVDSGTGLF